MSQIPSEHTTPSMLDEGGLRAPPGLSPWRKAWWWFDFLILVKLARLRFIAILLLIGLVITQWDWLLAYYDKLTRPDADVVAKRFSDTEYFCPMHPTIVRSEPGQKCPICFMPLARRAKSSAQSEPLPAGAVSRVQLSPYRIALAGVRTLAIDYQPLSKEISAVGTIEFNERGRRTVAARVKGRLEKLYINSTGQMVDAGDILAEIYSPEPLVTVRSLLDAKQRGQTEPLRSARVRLERWGIDEQQLNEMLARGVPDINLKILSPVSGHVITKSVREGQYVEEGTPLYELADLSTVWVVAQIHEDDLAFLPVKHDKRGFTSPSDRLPVTALTPAFPGEEFHGRLDFIYPHADQQTRTVAVRFELPNSDYKLRPGSTASVRLSIQPGEMPAFANRETTGPAAEKFAQGMLLATPETAVIDTGTQQIVYRERSTGLYEGIEVSLGPRMTGPDGLSYYPVLSGLAPQDRVVASGTFLVDAETRLNPAAGSIYFGAGGGVGASPGDAATGPAPAASASPGAAAGGQLGNASAGAAQPTAAEAAADEKLEAKVRASLAKLSAADRRLAEAQKFCATLDGSRLGAMGPPIKLLVEGQPVLVCCEGCRAQALADPAATLERVRQLLAAHARQEDRP